MAKLKRKLKAELAKHCKRCEKDSHSVSEDVISEVKILDDAIAACTAKKFLLSATLLTPNGLTLTVSNYSNAPDRKDSITRFYATSILKTAGDLNLSTDEFIKSVVKSIGLEEEKMRTGAILKGERGNVKAVQKRSNFRCKSCISKPLNL